MKWCMAVDILEIHISLALLDESDGLMDVGMIDGMKKEVPSYLLNLAYHFIYFNVILI